MAAPSSASWSFGLELSLLRDGKHMFGPERFELLRQIQTLGSIAAAAQATGVSYRTAWAAVLTLNNLAGEPLVERSKGGAKGGGATLTASGRRLLETYARLQARQQAFFDWMAQASGGEFSDYLALLARLNLRTSARNQLVGRVEHAEGDGPQATLHVRLMNEQSIRARVSRRSVDDLNLSRGATVVALFKASAVSVIEPVAPLPGDTNALAGTLQSLEHGGGHSELALALPGGYTIHALQADGTLPQSTAPGAAVIATFDPNVVLIAAHG
jgi:molybdate transport system regulatory protein